MEPKRNDLALWLLVLLGLWFIMGDGCSPGGGKPSAVTYVYEKDQTAIPAPVEAAINTLLRQGIPASKFEADAIDGVDEVPDQYKVPLAAAKEAGLPALVVQAGERVLRVVKDPRTEEQVMEAVR